MNAMGTKACKSAKSRTKVDDDAQKKRGRDCLQRNQVVFLPFSPSYFKQFVVFLVFFANVAQGNNGVSKMGIIRMMRLRVHLELKLNNYNLKIIVLKYLININGYILKREIFSLPLNKLTFYTAYSIKLTRCIAPLTPIVFQLF